MNNATVNEHRGPYERVYEPRLGLEATQKHEDGELHHRQARIVD